VQFRNYFFAHFCTSALIQTSECAVALFKVQFGFLHFYAHFCTFALFQRAIVRSHFFHPLWRATKSVIAQLHFWEEWQKVQSTFEKSENERMPNLGQQESRNRQIVDSQADSLDTPPSVNLGWNCTLFKKSVPKISLYKVSKNIKNVHRRLIFVVLFLYRYCIPAWKSTKIFEQCAVSPEVHGGGCV